MAWEVLTFVIYCFCDSLNFLEIQKHISATIAGKYSCKFSFAPKLFKISQFTPCRTLELQDETWVLGRSVKLEPVSSGKKGGRCWFVGESFILLAQCHKCLKEKKNNPVAHGITGNIWTAMEEKLFVVTVLRIISRRIA